MKVRLSSSKMDLVDGCPYKAYLQGVLRIEPVTKSSALVHGSVWHKIMEEFYTHVKTFGWDDVSGAIFAAGKAAKEEWITYQEKYNLYMDYRDFQTEMLMLTRYIETYSQSDEGFLEVISTEEKFELPLRVKSYNKDVSEITYTGVIDLRCKMNGLPWLVDHKTTSGSISREADKLGRSIQFIGYAWAERQLYAEAEGFMANFAGCSSRKKKDGTWGAKNIQFQRHPQLFSDVDFAILENHVNLCARNVAFYVKNNYWPKNYKSCFGYGKCRMYAQCQSGSREPIEGYRLAEENEKLSPFTY